MPRIDIPFVVEKQHITQPTREKLVGGGKNYFYATFTINDIWDEISDIKAVFVREGMSKLIELTETDSGFECQIPWEVMADKGIFQVGIFGGDRLLTDYDYVMVKEGCVVDGEAPIPPTPDWFNNIEQEITELESGKANKDDTYTKTEVNDCIDEQTEIIKSDVEGLRKQINEESHFRGYVSTNAEIQESKATPNDFVYSAESGTVWVYDTVKGWQDTGIPVPDQLTPASETTPLINGVASVGTEAAYARGDHRHPTDTTRASVVELNNKADKLKIEYWGTTDTDISLIHYNNTEIRYHSTPDLINFILTDGEYNSDYMTSVSFATYDTPPQISYTNSGIVNWVGTDCSLDNGISLFIPSPNMRYEIVVYFNGVHFVGLVNGYKSATGNVVSE